MDGKETIAERELLVFFASLSKGMDEPNLRIFSHLLMLFMDACIARVAWMQTTPQKDRESNR